MFIDDSKEEGNVSKLKEIQNRVKRSTCSGHMSCTCCKKELILKTLLNVNFFMSSIYNNYISVI